MTSDSEQVLCYNKGCGKKFDPNNNGDDACQYHPGHPVFHDALKGWSCCNKKSTDFSTFLSYPGCTKGPHSNVKPVEPEKPPKTVETNKDEVIVYEAPRMAEMTPRPTENEPLIELKRTIAPSLLTSLEKITESIKNTKIDESESQTVAVGTPCKNATCQARYESESSNNEKCTFHPGVAIFHEGMKYWSCCQRKTSDFDNFLAQAGCTEGSHLWFKQQTQEEKVDCRFDHHQAGGFVIVTVYSKNSVPDKTSIRANRIKLSIDLSFEGGVKSFVKEIELYGVIDLEQSSVNFFQTKVEIKLKKVDAPNWPKLYHVA